jgi:hypothetical protein
LTATECNSGYRTENLDYRAIFSPNGSAGHQREWDKRPSNVRISAEIVAGRAGQHSPMSPESRTAVTSGQTDAAAGVDVAPQTRLGMDKAGQGPGMFSPSRPRSGGGRAVGMGRDGGHPVRCCRTVPWDNHLPQVESSVCGIAERNLE